MSSCEGILYKKGKYLGWKKRKFILVGSVLQCLTNTGRPYKSTTLKSSLEVLECTQVSDSKYIFVINSGKSRITLASDTKEGRTMWVTHLLELSKSSISSADAVELMKRPSTISRDPFLWLHLLVEVPLHLLVILVWVHEVLM